MYRHALLSVSFAGSRVLIDGSRRADVGRFVDLYWSRSAVSVLFDLDFWRGLCVGVAVWSDLPEVEAVGLPGGPPLDVRFGSFGLPPSAVASAAAATSEVPGP